MPDIPTTLMSNNVNRPYDDFLPMVVLKKARELRQHPTGDVLPVSSTIRGGQRVAVYPWTKMELGDMFFSPIGSKSVNAMRISFHKAAARHDLEICVVRTIDPATAKVTDQRDEYGNLIIRGVDCLRVSVSAIGVNAAKKAAYDAGVIVQCPPVTIEEKRERRIRDRARWAENMRKYRSKKKTKSPKVRAAAGEYVRGDKRTDPFWADRDEVVATETSTVPLPDPQPEEGIFTHAGMSREEKLRAALRKDRREPKN